MLQVYNFMSIVFFVLQEYLYIEAQQDGNGGGGGS